MKPRAIVFHIVTTRGVIAATRAIRSTPRKRGFALVATMLMMILILVVAVGLLSLSTISVRSTSTENIRRMAKSNARLALGLALADIQKHLGDDRRVTADAAILAPAIKQSGLVGVWESAANTLPENPLGSPPDYNNKKFISWLVSTAKPEDAGVLEMAATLPGGETVALFSEDLDGTDLTANVLTLKNNKSPGGLAWAVSQAATKASINVGIDLAHEQTNEQLGAPDRPNISLSDIAEQPWDGWKERRSKVIDMNQAMLDSNYAIPPDKKAALALEHTVQSLGVPADVTKGGLKTDLSLGFELSDSDFKAASWQGTTNPFSEAGMPGNEKRLYQSIGSSGTVTLNSDYGPVKYTMNMDTGTPPTFASLRSYYSLYKHLYRYGGNPTARQRFQASPSYDNPSTYAPRGSETSVNPVLDRVLLYFSLTSNGRDLALLITPVVTLWNPYNVAIESDGYVAYPYIDMPIVFSITNRGATLIGDHLTRYLGRGFGEGWNDPQHGRQAEAFFYCKITEGGGAATSSPVRLEPGEVRLFAPATTSRVVLDRAGVDSNENQAMGHTLRMKPLGSGPTDYIPTNGGLIVRLNDKSGGGGIAHPVQPGDQLQVTFNFQTGDYNYFLNLEDATRIRNPATPALAKIPRITETQVLSSQTPSVTITSPTISGSLVRGTASKVFAVVETYHRTAGQQDTIQAADIVYTVNPRQRHTNYMVSGASDMKNAHYSSALRSVSDIGADVSNYGGRSFYGIANSPPAGRDILSFFEVPQAPMMSLGAFQNADLSNSAFSPSSQFGNSWASPYIDPAKVAKVLGNASSVNTNRLEPNGLGLFDHSYLLNAALWDSCFFSSLAPESTLGSSRNGNAYDTDLSQVSKGLDKVVADWVKDPIANPLRNRRHILHLGGMSAGDVEKKLLEPAGCREAAAHILVEGSFNVNSVNEKAWRAMFASLRGQKFQINGGKKSHDSGSKTPASRMTNPSGEPEDPWNGFRELDDGQIRDLAKEVVSQVRARGPFQSLGEFVNRRLSGDDNGRKGALQAAIDKAGINKDVDTGTFVTDGYPFKNNIPSGGNNTGVGTPGWVTQADVLNALGPFASVRSDTFTVRAYGDARDASGNILSRCYLEAQVQRVPEWLDSSNKAADPIASLSPVNKTFGRKFEVVSVREVSPQEL